MDRGDEIVVSGIGLVSPLGASREATWHAVLAGRSAVRRCTDPAFPYDVHAPVVEAVSPESPTLDRSQRFAVAAVREAIDDAGLSRVDLADVRTGWTIGFSKGAILSLIEQHAALRAGRSVDLAGTLRYGPGMALAEVVRCLGGGGGPAASPVLACATGLASVLTAARWVRCGLVDRVIAGAAEASMDPLVVGAFASMGVFAPCSPEGAACSCRPFERDRSGFVMGEGAGVLVVERAEAARRRGAPVYATLSGGTTGMVADHVVQSDTGGAMLADLIRRALDLSQVPAGEVDYVHAHGTGTQLSDLAELNALEQVFGRSENRPLLGSTKAATGHLLGAAGAVEAALACLALRDGITPPTLNLRHADPACLFDIPTESRKTPLRHVLKLSAGFGGCGAVMVLSAAR